jgi:hypothetical protein
MLLNKALVEAAAIRIDEEGGISFIEPEGVDQLISQEYGRTDRLRQLLLAYATSGTHEGYSRGSIEM